MKKTYTTLKKIYIFFLIIYFICLPLNAINIGPFGSALKIVALLPVFISLIALFYGQKLKLTAALISQFSFIVFAFFSIIWSISPNFSLSRVISYTLLFILLTSGATFKYTLDDINKIKNALAWSSRITALIMFIFAEYYNGRFRLMGTIKEDPNYLCAYLSFGVIFALEKLVSKTFFKYKIVSILELAVYFYLILVSGSRGGLLSILSSTIIFILLCGKTSIRNLLKKTLLALLILLSILILIEYLPDSLKIRFSLENVLENGASGRTTIWLQAFDLFFKSNIIRMLLGYGTATMKLCFESFGYSEVNVAHNMFIETLLELGIIGLILYAAIVFIFFKTSYKFKDKFAFSIMFCMFVMSLSTSIYTFKPYYNIMLYIIMFQSQVFNNTQNRNA